jgi:hypothetical protein
MSFGGILRDEHLSMVFYRSRVLSVLHNYFSYFFIHVLCWNTISYCIKGYINIPVRSWMRLTHLIPHRLILPWAKHILVTIRWKEASLHGSNNWSYCNSKIENGSSHSSHIYQKKLTFIHPGANWQHRMIASGVPYFLLTSFRDKSCYTLIYVNTRKTLFL